MNNCPICNEPFEPGTRFCIKCGCNLTESSVGELVCPICKKNYPAGAVFCPEDGTRLVSQDKLQSSYTFNGAQNAETEEVYFKKADLGNRFIAYILDSLFTIGLSIPFIILFLLSSDYDSNRWNYNIYSLIFYCLMYIIPAIYAFIKDGIGDGQSWGKKIMKIKVINVIDHTNCTKCTSALRTLITSLLGIIPFLEPIVVLLTADGRRLADKFVGTMVINTY